MEANDSDRVYTYQEGILTVQIEQTENSGSGQIREHVAELQLHMALHARNLVPTFERGNDPRQQLLQESQALLEKLASRQSL